MNPQFVPGWHPSHAWGNNIDKIACRYCGVCKCHYPGASREPCVNPRVTESSE